MHENYTVDSQILLSNEKCLAVACTYCKSLNQPVLTLKVSSQQVEPGEQDDGRKRRHQQLQASTAQQVHDGMVTLRALRVRVGGEEGFKWGSVLHRVLAASFYLRTERDCQL